MAGVDTGLNAVTLLKTLFIAFQLAYSYRPYEIP